MADGLETRRLGSSGLDVSILSLGSWKTFERLPHDTALAVMAAARDHGITFYDDARYNDETGSAPLATGYSEVVFGDLFRATFSTRDDVVVANKLWWEFWPEQSAAAELDASLDRLRFDHVDLIYALPPPDLLGVEAAVDAVAGLIRSGRARAWGVANWPAGDIAKAVEIARSLGVPGPCAAQLPYSVVRRDWVDDPAMDDALSGGDITLVASFVLAGGILTGKYAHSGSGRYDWSNHDAVNEASVRAAAGLGSLGRAWGVTPANLAFAFALEHPRLASVLFGATSVEQLTDNIRSIDVHASLTADQLAELRSIAT